MANQNNGQYMYISLTANQNCDQYMYISLTANQNQLEQYDGINYLISIYFYLKISEDSDYFSIFNTQRNDYLWKGQYSIIGLPCYSGGHIRLDFIFSHFLSTVPIFSHVRYPCLNLFSNPFNYLYCIILKFIILYYIY